MRWWLLVSLGASFGCFGPDVSGVRCSSEGLCPTGLVCDRSDSVCRRPGDPLIDAGADADVAGGDRDGDAVADAEDNCADLANADQADEDGDGRGDVCDNCPGVANSAQADVLELSAGDMPDGVGDACDPRPTDGGDSIAVFEPFNDLAAWEVGAGADDWEVQRGRLLQQSTDSTTRILAYRDGLFSRVAVEATIVPLEIAPAGTGNDSRNIGVVAQYDSGIGQGIGYACAFNTTADLPGESDLVLLSLDGGATLLGSDPAADLEIDSRFRVQLTADASVPFQRCSGIRQMSFDQVAAADPDRQAGAVGLRLSGVSAEIPYVVIYNLGATGGN